jgi:hypothetical protein
LGQAAQARQAAPLLPPLPAPRIASPSPLSPFLSCCSSAVPRSSILSTRKVSRISAKYLDTLEFARKCCRIVDMAELASTREYRNGICRLNT